MRMCGSELRLAMTLGCWGVCNQVRQSLGMSPLYVKMIGGRDELSLLQLGEEELSHMTKPTPRRQVGVTSCEGQPHTLRSSIQDVLVELATHRYVSSHHSHGASDAQQCWRLAFPRWSASMLLEAQPETAGLQLIMANADR